MEKLIRKLMLWLILVGIFILTFTSYVVEADVTAPSFATLPINDNMITRVGNAGSSEGQDGHKYVQITDTTKQSSGAVWFINPVSFSRSFHLEMSFYIDNTANDSDGIAFVMQSSGANAIAAETGPTLGVWSNIGGTDPLSQGAIANSFAIEFDTYHNNDSSWLGSDRMMDRDVPAGHHIAWAFPGANASYTSDGLIRVDKVLNHQNVVSVTDLSDSQWHTFFVDYSTSSQTFRYQVPDFGVDVTIPVDTTFKDNLNITNGAPVYFGFTGANGGYVQEKAVAFVNVEGLVDLQMRTGVFQSGEMQPLLDTEVTMTQEKSVDVAEEIFYVTSLDYRQTSDLARLDSGNKLFYTLPDDMSVETVFFNQYVPGTPGLPSGGTPLSFNQEAGKLVTELPMLEKDNIYTVSFTARYRGKPVDKNVDLVVPVETTFSGNPFVSSFTSGSAETHYYYVKGKLPPTLTMGALSFAEAQDNLTLVRQNRDYFTEIAIDDQNSTQAQVFVSDFYTEESELTEESFTEKKVIQRSDLTGILSDTLKLSTENLTPGKTYYFAVYVKDTEGNVSEIRYFGIDFRGIVQLLKVPKSLNGRSLTLNQLAQSIRSDGYAYVEIPTDEQERILEVSNTSEGSWKLSGQTSAFMNGELSLADEVQLVLYNPQDNELFCTIDSSQKVLFEKTPQDGQTFVLDLGEYNCYLRFKTAIESITPGTYLGEVQWQLESTITNS